MPFNRALHIITHTTNSNNLVQHNIYN